jgi:hypothetical protein
VIPNGPITVLNQYPGSTVVTIAMNPTTYRQVYVSDINNKVWGSSNEGATWVNLTSDLYPHLTSQVTTIEVFNTDGTIKNTILYAGGLGVFQLTDPTTTRGSWTLVVGTEGDKISSRIPPALVLDLHYDYSKNGLLVGTLGRGAWLFGAGTPTVTASGGLPSISSLASVTTAAAKAKGKLVPPVAYPQSASRR